MTPEEVGAALRLALEPPDAVLGPWKPCSTSSLTIETVGEPDGRVQLRVSTTAEWSDRKACIDFCESVPREEAGAKVTQVLDDAIRRHCMTRELINPMELLKAWVVPEEVPAIQAKYDRLLSEVVDMTDRGVHAKKQVETLTRDFGFRVGFQIYDEKYPMSERLKFAAKHNNLNERLRRNAVALENSRRMLELTSTDNNKETTGLLL